MRARSIVLGLLLGLALVGGQAARAAAVGSVSSSVAATGITNCNGVSTVTMTLTGVEPPPAQRHLDVELVLDESGSVSATDFSRLRSGAATFANSLLAGGLNRLGVVQFSSDARALLHPTGSASSAVSAINGMFQRGGSTAIGRGLQLAQQEFTQYGRSGVQRVIILETDGNNNVDVSSLPTVVSSIKSAGTLIFTVGIGTSIDEAELRSIASTIPGVVTTYLNPNYTQLAATLESIAGTIEVPSATGASYHVTAAPGFTISGATATAGSVSAAADGFTWSLATLREQTVTITYQATYTGDANGEHPFQSVADLHWTDDGGSAQTVSYAAETVTVSGCNHPPVADAGTDQTVQLNGSHSAPVSLDASASSDPDGDALTYEWTEGGASLGTGATPTVPLGLGVHHMTVTVSDGSLTASDDVTVTVVDPSAPSVTPVITGTLGNNGWYTSNVGVSWTVTDLESDVTASGCDAATVSTDTPGVSFTCSATSAGGTTSRSVEIKRDATAPVVTYSGVHATYGLSETVAITCAASDALSGVAPTTCPGASGPAYTFPGTTTLRYDAVDAAGNVGHGTASFSVPVSAASICSLVNAWVSNGGVANSLCVKLQHGTLDAFRNEVAAQRGKKLTAAQADILTALSRAL